MKSFEGISDADMLARIMDAEAGQEGPLGKLAVGAVIRNRAQTGGYGDGIRGVIIKPGQFSAINDVTGYAGGKGANKIFWREPSEESRRVAQMVLSGQYKDPTQGATHYYNPKAANPKWARGKQFRPIGNHVFGNADAGRVTGGGGATTLQGGPGRSDYFEQMYEKRQAQKPTGQQTQQAAPVADGRSQFFDQEFARRQKAKAAPEPAQEAPAEEQSFAAGLLDSFTSGVTLGLGDELTALENAALGGTDEESFWEEYDRFLAAERDQNKAFATENPVTDIVAKGAGAVAGVVASGAPQAVGRILPAAVSTTGKVAGAAGAGATGAAVVGFNEGEGGLANRATNAAVAAPFGAAGGVIGREVGIAAQRALGPLVKRGLAFASGQLTPRAVSALEKAGIDPAMITREVVEAFETRARRSGVSPETANRAAADEFAIPLTKGQAAGTFEDQAFEEAARTGARGVPAQRIAGAQKEAQDDAIQNALDGIVEGPARSVNEAGDAVGRGVTAARDAAKREYQVAYDAVPSGTVIRADALDNLQLSVRSALDAETLTPSSQAKAAIAQIDALSERVHDVDGIMGVDFNAIEGLRQKLNKISGRVGKSDPQAAFEINSVKSALDDWIDDSVADALISGDDAAIEAVKSARGKYRAFKQLFTKTSGNDDAGRMLEKIVDPDITPQEVARYLYGASKTGAAGHSVRVAKRIERMLGKKSPEWADLRRGAWLHVIKAGDDAASKPGAQQLSERILEFVTGDGKALARTLYSEAELMKMRRLAVVLKKTVPPRGATNPSGTGAALARTIEDASGAVMTGLGVATGNPGTAFGMRLMQGVLRATGGRAKAAKNFNPAGEKQTRTGSAGGVTAGAVSGAEAGGAVGDRFRSIAGR